MPIIWACQSFRHSRRYSFYHLPLCGGQAQSQRGHHRELAYLHCSSLPESAGSVSDRHPFFQLSWLLLEAHAHNWWSYDEQHSVRWDHIQDTLLDSEPDSVKIVGNICNNIWNWTKLLSMKLQYNICSIKFTCRTLWFSSSTIRDIPFWKDAIALAFCDLFMIEQS